MNSVLLSSFIECEWHNPVLGTLPYVSIELVNVPSETVGRIKTIFNETLRQIGALDYVDVLDVYEFDERQCPQKGSPIKIHFVCASFGRVPQGSNLATMGIIARKIAHEIKSTCNTVTLT